MPRGDLDPDLLAYLRGAEAIYLAALATFALVVLLLLACGARFDLADAAWVPVALLPLALLRCHRWLWQQVP